MAKVENKEKPTKKAAPKKGGRANKRYGSGKKNTKVAARAVDIDFDEILAEIREEKAQEGGPRANKSGTADQKKGKKAARDTARKETKTNGERLGKGKKSGDQSWESKNSTPEVKKSTSKKSSKKAAKNDVAQIKENAQKETKAKETNKEVKKEIKETKKEEKKKGKRPSGKLRVMSLGGLGEIGKNITVFEYGNDIVVIDAGMGFPDEDMLGIDLVIPDISYLVQNADKIRGILITHGHEDHIGAIPYILRQINVPVYGTRLSLGIIEGKLDEIKPGYEPELYTVEAGDVISLGVFKAEFIHVNHSIADACAIALKTPLGTVFHSGDFKLDVSPIDGKIMDLVRIGEIGREGVELLLCESTNATRAGYTPSERTVGSSLERIFMQYEDKRLIIATFSSNVHRVQQIIDTSARHGRKVAVLGRSMVNVIGAAAELGYMEFPDGVLIDVADMKNYRPNEITLITTGSQGEPMSALYRIAFAEHDKVKLATSDVVVLSSSAIPGNEKLVGKIINALVKSGVKVVSDSVEDVHVSGHACREEIKLLMALLKPKYFMPIHGEERHLYANKEIGEFMGIAPQNIFISEIGRVLELDAKGARFNGTVSAGNVLVDGSGVGDIGSSVLRDRRLLATEGLVVVVISLDLYRRELLSYPEIISRGFVYVKEAEELVSGARDVVIAALDKAFSKRGIDRVQIKNTVKDELARFIYKETKRRPMILPILMEN